MQQSLAKAEDIANKLYYDVQDRDQQLARLNGLFALGGNNASS